MFKSMLTSLSKECKKLFHNKMIFVVMLLIPFLVNLLLGYEFSKDQIQNISMAVWDQDNSSLSRMILQHFRENEIFDIRYAVENSEDIKDLFDQSKVKVAMIIPKDFGQEVMALHSPTVMMLYDGSHMSIAAAAKTRASEILLTLKAGILIKFLEGKMNLPASVAEKMALSIKFSNRVLYNPAKSFKNFLNPGFGTAIVQTGIVLMGAVAIHPEEMGETKRKKIGYFFAKLLFYTLLGWLGLMMSILLQKNLFLIPFRGSLGDAALLSLWMSASAAAFSIMVSVWVKNKLLATQMNAILFIPSTIIVGYTWPIMAMPEGYQRIAFYMPFHHYVHNLRNIFLKGTPLSSMGTDIHWFMGFMAIVCLISLLGLFRSSSSETLSQEKEVEALGLS